MIFYKTATGREPVREWLMTLPKEQRTTIGVDIWKAQSEWPLGMPHVRALGDGLHEVQSNFPEGIARTLCYVDHDVMVLLHGFIKKTEKMPPADLSLGRKRKKDHEQNKKS